MPITQAELADASGLSTVHVNRTMQELRRDGLIKTENGSVIIQDWDGLREAAEFDSGLPRPRNRARSRVSEPHEGPLAPRAGRVGFAGTGRLQPEAHQAFAQRSLRRPARSGAAGWAARQRRW